MEDKNQLIQNLRSLRMPGILENLDNRVLEAKENGLSHLEFLSLVIQDERLQRNNNQVAKCIRYAGFGNQKTFETFDFLFNAKSFTKGMMNELKTCQFIDMGQNVVIAGPPGIGKTHIAKALGHEACRHKKHVLFCNTYSLFQQLEQSVSDAHFSRLFNKINKSDLLILDDFAFRKFEMKEIDILYSILDSRQGCKSIIVTSNRPTEDWINIFPDPVVGGALLDRMVSSAYKIIIKRAKSYRKEGGITFTDSKDDTKK